MPGPRLFTTVPVSLLASMLTPMPGRTNSLTIPLPAMMRYGPLPAPFIVHSTSPFCK